MQTRLSARPNEPKLSICPPSGATPLWGVWEMWCVLPDAPQTRTAADQSNWLDEVRSLGLFDNAEGYWGIARCTLPPSRLAPGVAYYVLRRHIPPMWEHEANRRGGRWVIRFNNNTNTSSNNNSNDSNGNKNKNRTLSPPGALEEAVDAAWERLGVALIAEQTPTDETEICGAAIRRAEKRREWKLSLWTRHAKDAATQMTIGRYVKALLQLEDGAMQYWTHKELMKATLEGRWGVPPTYEL